MAGAVRKKPITHERAERNAGAMNMNPKNNMAATRIAIEAPRDVPGKEMPLHGTQMIGLDGLEKKRDHRDID